MDGEGAGGRWQALFWTGLAVVLSLTTWFSATAVLPELTMHLDLTAVQAAWLTNAVQVGFVVGALGSSVLALADVWPLTRFMAGAALLAAGSNVLLVFVPDAVGTTAARFVTGVALAGIYPPALKLIATWFRSGRGLAMGVMVGALTLGSAMPHLLRASDSGLSWETVVLLCSVGSLAAAAIFGLVVREGPYAALRTPVSLRRMGAIFGNRPVMLANAGYFGHMWELYAMWGWFLAYATSAAAAGLTLPEPSLLTFLVIGSGAVGCLAGGFLSDRIGRCRTTMLMLAMSGMSAVLIGVFFNGPIWLFMPVALIWGFSVVADSAQFSAAVSELSDPSTIGSALAFQMGVGFSITIVAIWLTPVVADALGSWRWSFLVLVPGPVAGFLAMRALRRHPAAAAMASGRR